MGIYDRWRLHGYNELGTHLGNERLSRDMSKVATGKSRLDHKGAVLQEKKGDNPDEADSAETLN